MLAALDRSALPRRFSRPPDVPSARLSCCFRRLRARCSPRIAGTSTMLSWRLIPGVRGAGFVALVLRVALLGSRSARTCSRSSRAGRRIRRSGVPGGGCRAPSWRPGTRWGPLALVVSCRAGCVSAASPEPFRSPAGVLFSVRTEALAVVLSGGLAAHRCRVGLLYGVQSRWALLYAVRIMGFAVRAGPSKASVRALCSTSFRLQSGRRRRSFPLYCRPCSRRRRGCVVGAVQRRFGVVRYGV